MNGCQLENHSFFVHIVEVTNSRGKLLKLTKERLHYFFIDAGQHFEGIVQLHESVTNC